MSGDAKGEVLAILAGARSPMTTAQIKRELKSTRVGDIYAVLFQLQSSGLIERSISAPWRWIIASGTPKASSCSLGNFARSVVFASTRSVGSAESSY